jgi:hypothetical protein
VTGADGRFFLASVSPLCWIGARARGYAPTKLRLAGGRPGGRVELSLALPGPGGSVAGIVVDPWGAAVAGATVLVGVPAEIGHEEVDGVLRAAPAVTLVTDAHGAFHADGIAPGQQSVLVRTAAFAPFEGRVEIEQNGCATLCARLAPGAVLSGTVRDGSGQPLANARVGVGGDLSFLAFTRSRDTFLGSFSQSASDGSFRLTGLPAGPLLAWAKTRHGERAERELVAVAGQRMSWDPVLGSPAIAGRVVDHCGRPLAGWRVEASCAAELCSRDLAETDAAGRFVVARPRSEVDRIDAREPLSMRVCASAAMPPAGEITIRVARDAHPSAYLVGSVRNARGAPPGGLRVVASRAGVRGVPGTPVDATTGSFRVGPLPPAEYDVVITAGDAEVHRSARQHLVPHETRDLGMIVLPD